MNLPKEQKTKIKKIAKKYKLKLVIAFGSFVTGNMHSESDIDIAVMPKNELNYKKFFSLVSELGKVFTDRKIDMSLLNRANPLLLYKICSNPILLYGNARDFSNLRIYSFKNYIDYQPYFRMEKKFVRNFINKYALR